MGQLPHSITQVVEGGKEGRGDQGHPRAGNPTRRNKAPQRFPGGNGDAATRPPCSLVSVIQKIEVLRASYAFSAMGWYATEFSGLAVNPPDVEGLLAWQFLKYNCSRWPAGRTTLRLRSVAYFEMAISKMKSVDSSNSIETPMNPNPEHLVWIKPGTFTMGSPIIEVDRLLNEGPPTQVKLSQGFWMSKFETNQTEYQSVIGTNPSYDKGDGNLPVEMVSWDDAINYCRKLAERERAVGLPAGYEYRLPTEAEWEYACRAGTTTRFGYGEDSGYAQLGDYAWYFSNSGNTTHPVGVKKPNAWGLYDMHGNVWEWCLDWYGDYLGGSMTDLRGSHAASNRVFRGGSWGGNGRGCRSAFRVGSWPGNRGNGIGFRSVLAPGQ